MSRANRFDRKPFRFSSLLISQGVEVRRRVCTRMTETTTVFKPCLQYARVKMILARPLVADRRGAASVGRVLAARAKAAMPPRVDRRRDLAFQNHPLTARSPQVGDRRHQRPRIRTRGR